MGREADGRGLALGLARAYLRARGWSEAGEAPGWPAGLLYEEPGEGLVLVAVCDEPPGAAELAGARSALLALLAERADAELARVDAVVVDALPGEGRAHVSHLFGLFRWEG